MLNENVSEIDFRLSVDVGMEIYVKENKVYPYNYQWSTEKSHAASHANVNPEYILVFRNVLLILFQDISLNYFER